MEGMEGMEAVAHNPPAIKTRRGFNLIEAAIVLGVVGLIIGGIWVTASAVNDNWKVSNTINGILYIKNNIQNLIGTSQAAAMQEYIETEMASAGVIPGDWLSNETITNPFNGIVVIKNQYDVFDVRLSKIPKSACIKLLTQISGLRDSSIMTITVVESNMSTSTFPIPVYLAESSYCTAATNRIWFTFSYTHN